MIELRGIVAAIIAAGGGGAAIAWLIFSKLGDRWLAQTFEKRLEAFKHEQAKEIEQLKHRIASQFSRISKVHEREFDVLPTAWLKLNQAEGALFNLIVALKNFPALGQMSRLQFEEFVAECKLPNFRKSELLEASDRDEYYRRWIWWVEFGGAKNEQIEFNNYLVLNSIFMTESLRKQFGEINDLFKSVLITEEVRHATPNRELAEQVSADFKKIRPLMSTLEAEIQKRLHYDEA